MLLNVNQFESVPFVTSTSGVVIVTDPGDVEFIDFDRGTYVPTGFQTNIAISKVTNLIVTIT